MSQTPNAPPKSGTPQLFSAKTIVIMAIQIALIVGPLVLGALLLGRFLDTQLSTGPWLTVGFAVASSILASIIAYRVGMRTVLRVDRELPWPKKQSTPTTEAQPDDHKDQ